MGAKLPRHFRMRNPFFRGLVLTVALLVVGGMLLRSDMKATTMKTAASAGQALILQKPFNWNNKPKVEAPVEQDGAQADGTQADATEAEGTQAEDVPTAISNSSHVMTCDYDMEKLKQWQKLYHLEETFEYMKRYIQISRNDIPRKSVTKLDQNFLGDAVKVVDVNKQYQADTCPEPLRVPVTKSPFPSTANASDFMFGVSTTYKRFSDPRTSPINEWSYWLTDGKGHSNGGKLVLMLLDASDAELEAAYTKITTAGIDVDVYRSDSSLIMAVRYLTLVPQLYNHPERPSKKWLVICDDDTFFPSFHALADRFADYDDTTPMYIGTFSEDVNNIARHGSQAFGGAGVFLSIPMASIITEKYDSCRTDRKIYETDTGWGPQGDILLRKCIYENSEVKLTLLRDLWQLDLLGDPSGFYESGIKPLSLHHYRGGIWHVAHPWHYTKVAHACGEDCTLQRFRTADDFVIANGFSVAYYPRGIDFDLGQFEATFHAAPENRGWNLDFMMGPQRPSLHGTGRKISWDLQNATLHEDGSVSQVYVCRKDDWRWKNPDGSRMNERDGIMELVWLPEEKE
ncbi:hypothetical protein N0V88_006742 [Collariella sp. IMI 366227]|nr:hypothetical protein N0V88_006742 [Collariella sp. IMI 366227]